MDNNDEKIVKPQRNDERNENEEISQVVNRNKNGLPSGSHNMNVNRFGVSNNRDNHQDLDNIKNKLASNRSRNLNENRRIQDEQFNIGSEEPEVISSESDDGEAEPVAAATSAASSATNTLGNVAKNGKKLANKLGKKGASKGAEAGLEGAAKGATKSAAKGASKAVKEGGKALVKATKAVGSAIAKGVQSIIAFLSSVIGPGALVIGGLFLLIVFIIVIIQMIVNSLGLKFGIDSTNIEEIFRDEYIEGLNREEIEEIISENYSCKLTWWQLIKNFFGVYDLTEPCEFINYIKKEIENRENGTGPKQDRHGRQVQVDTEDDISPGYFFATLYYAFDTQNYDEEGNLYIPLPMSGHTNYNDDGKEIETILISDIDVINVLLKTKKPDTNLPIYTKSDIEKLLDNYIFFEDHHNDDSAHGEGPYYYNGYKYGWPYWLYQYIIVGYDEDGEPIWDWACVQQVPETYYTDELKFKLYLRYGQEVMDEYERDQNWNLQWRKTHDTCKAWTGWTKWANGDLEENGSVYLEEPPSMSKYNTKADPDSEANDNAKITISKGTFGYDSGFIYKTYPRYDDNYIVAPMEYGYKVDKDIERIIQTIDSRQDYINYVLGYPSSVQQYMAGISNGSYSYNGGAVCSFNIGGAEVSDIKVRLKHARYNTSVPEDLAGKPIEGQELIDFDKYIMGVVYAENGGSAAEALKVQAIAAASYILSSYKVVSENGVNIIEISNSTWEQTYCDPDKGCDICFSNNQSTLSLYTKGTVPEGANCKHHKNPLASDSPLRGAVKSVSGQVLQDANGKIIRTTYGGNEQSNWQKWASEGKDYIEILREQYGSEYAVSEADCNYGSVGDWAEWDQGDDPWGSFLLGSSGSTTMARIGCFTTVHAMAIAAGAKNILIPNFNPGTFAEAVKRAGGYTSSGALYSDIALNVAVGEGNWSSKPVNLAGSYEHKVGQVASLLEEGYVVILRVKSPASNAINGKGDEHYVLVTGINGSNIIMADPAGSVSSNIVLDAYLEQGLTWAKGLKFK